MRTFDSEDPDEMPQNLGILSGSTLFAKTKTIFGKSSEMQFYLKIVTCDPLMYTMDQFETRKESISA